MFTRSIIALATCLLCPVLAACGDSAESADTDGNYGSTQGGTLSVLSPTQLRVAPRGTAEIRIVYLADNLDGKGGPEPLAGVAIEFALVGDAKGASLSPERSINAGIWAQAVTDENGEAVAQLTVGSDAAEFRVRASAAGAAPAYVDVSVSKSAVREVQVTASYSGLRDLALRTVTVLPGLGCDAALAALANATKGETTDAYDNPEGSLTFELGPGLHYAIIGWGSGRRGGVLADGCTEIDVPVAPGPTIEGVTIELRDRALTLRGSYKVTLELDVARSAQRAGETAIAGGQSVLSTANLAGADYFLDAIEAGMRRAGRRADADALVVARMGGTLDTSLQADLNGANAGPQPWLAKLGSEIQDRGSRLALQASYGVTSVAGVPMSLTLSAMQSRSADGMRSLSCPATLLPVTSIDAQYDDARAVIAVDTIRIQLPLGTYAGHLLDAIEAAEKNGLVGLLAPQSGCDELVQWAAKQPVVANACDGNCVSAACDSAIDVLLMKATAKLTTLDVDHPSIGVRGELLVSDSDSDSIVDELGTAAFQGSWGKAPRAEQADPVDADFSVISSVPAL